MGIGTKIALGYVAPLVVFAASGLVVYRTLAATQETGRALTAVQEVVRQAHRVESAVVDAQSGVRGYVITGDEAFLERYDDGLTGVEDGLAELERRVADRPEQQARLAQLEEHYDELLPFFEEVVDVRAAGDEEAAEALVVTGFGKQQVDEVEALLEGLVAAEEESLEALLADSVADFDRARLAALLGPLAAVALTAAVAVAVARHISRRLASVTDAAAALAGGQLSRRADVDDGDEVGALARSFNLMADDLQHRIESESQAAAALQAAVAQYSAFAGSVAAGDLTARVSVNGTRELGDLADNLNGMASGLGELSADVREGVRRLSAAAAEIAAAVNQHTSSATQQSAAIAEVTTTVDEVRATAEQAASQARDVADKALRSVQVSDDGAAVVEGIVRRMDDIRVQVGAIAEGIVSLSGRTQEIGEITALVDDLADQSAILALNATIEAARAGEHGRGFAVVAAEVGNLAEQSKQATTQVRSILGDIQRAADRAVLAAEQGTAVVGAGVELAQRAGGTIGQLADTIGDAAHAAEIIAASAHEQSVGMDQISHAMRDINEATTQFVAGAEQSRATAEELDLLSRQLSALTERYRV